MYTADNICKMIDLLIANILILMSSIGACLLRTFNKKVFHNNDISCRQEGIVLIPSKLIFLFLDLNGW